MSYKAYAAALLLAGLPLGALAVAQTQTPQPAPSSEARAEAREKVRAACAGDVQKFCAHVDQAKGAIRSCLQSNESQLSDNCKAARMERAAARAKDKS